MADDLRRVDAPSKADLLAAFGDRELERMGGRLTLEEVLEPLGEETVASAEAVERTVLTMVGDEAVGRVDDSDPGGLPDVPDHDEESPLRPGRPAEGVGPGDPGRSVRIRRNQ